MCKCPLHPKLGDSGGAVKNAVCWWSGLVAFWVTLRSRRDACGPRGSGVMVNGVYRPQERGRQVGVGICEVQAVPN